MPTPQDKSPGSQLSNEAIKERLRPYAPRAVERLVELLESKNDPTALGAAKEILGRFVPLLRSVELSGSSDKPLLVWDIDGLKEFLKPANPLPRKTD